MISHPSLPEVAIPARDLETGDLIAFAHCPFALPPADDLDFLRAQDPTGFGHKDVSYDPATGRVVGLRGNNGTAARLKSILTEASRTVVEWLRTALPDYAPELTPDRVTLRTQEEATRALRVTARNDLLHIDQFSTRPSFGRRVLRLSVNIHPDRPWIWATADRFPELLNRFGEFIRVPDLTDAAWCSETATVTRLLRRGRAGRSEYDF